MASSSPFKINVYRSGTVVCFLVAVKTHPWRCRSWSNSDVMYDLIGETFEKEGEQNSLNTEDHILS